MVRRILAYRAYIGNYFTDVSRNYAGHQPVSQLADEKRYAEAPVEQKVQEEEEAFLFPRLWLCNIMRERVICVNC